MLQRGVLRAIVAVVLAVLVSSCAASRAYTRGQTAASAGDWDAAVEYYRQALQDQPDRPEYKIALERSVYAAASLHIDRGRAAEAGDKLDDALREYRKTLEYTPGNREIAAKAATIERTLRARLEAAQPRPEIERLQEQARRISQPPLLNPASREPLVVNFVNSSIKDIMNSISSLTGINVVFDQGLQDRQTSIRLDGVTLEEALDLIMISSGLFYKVLSPRAIFIAQDTQAKRTQFEDQVVQTFYLANAEAADIVQMLNQVIRIPGTVPPTIAPNKTSNTVTVRASASVVKIVERMIRANDRPRAEVVIDVQILEVSRSRTKEFGLDLSQYQAGLIFSPEGAPTAGGGGDDDDDPAPGGSTFNLNTITRGISTNDFYLTVPSAVIKFLESDNQTKVLAKPQLRGAEGLEVSVNLGEDVPVPSTTFTPLATGGANTNPLTSFNYRQLGIIVKMTPRVTYSGDVILDVSLENSSRGNSITIAGQSLPAFNSRKVQTRLRLRDGESNLIAGLLREDNRRDISGLPGIVRAPILRNLFANNSGLNQQTDIVMLLTPRVVRSHELTAEDLAPIYIGSTNSLGLGGPPPLIAAPEMEAPPAGAQAAVPGQALPGTVGAVPTTPAGAPAPAPIITQPGQQVPVGSGPVPGFTSPGPVTPQPAQPPPQPTANPFGQPAPAGQPPPQPDAAQPQVTNPFAALMQPQTQPPPSAQPAQPTQPAGAPATPPVAVPAAGQVSLTVPADVRVGGGPYTVPISLAGVQRLSTITLTLTFNPAVVRVRSVTEGTLMRQGGVNAPFTQKVDPAGRVEIAITRTGDQTGVSGSGVLAALVLEPVAAGAASLSVSGVGTLAGGGLAPLQFLPATITVK